MTQTKDATEGHAAHSPEAEQIGLRGTMDRPIKLTFLGAGSFFVKQIALDLLTIPGSLGGEIALVDIDADRLDLSRRLLEKMVATFGQGQWKVSATTDRRKALPGSHYLVNSIEVSGVECVRHDNDIPLRYGIDQCIGDTIGPGGLFKALRTIPVWLEILRDAEDLCPEALVLNYTNPMVMMCLAANRSTRMATVGLCHSVQGTVRLLAKRAGVPFPELDWTCAGINHLAWVTRLQHRGRDLYPDLMDRARRDLAGDPVDPDDAEDLVRKDMMLHFGAFITESSGHLSEYLPYYRKRSELLQKYGRSGYGGEGGFYAANWPTWRKKQDEQRLRFLQGEEAINPTRSLEYASWIIEAREKNTPFVFHGNVSNSTGGADALISNLSLDNVVEVACLVDRNGIQPTRFGQLPPQMAALCESNLRVFDLGARAAMEKSVEAAIHALLLDPLTAAMCSPAEIKQMTLEMFAAEKDYLPGYR